MLDISDRLPTRAAKKQQYYSERRSENQEEEVGKLASSMSNSSPTACSNSSSDTIDTEKMRLDEKTTIISLRIVVYDHIGDDDDAC